MALDIFAHFSLHPNSHHQNVFRNLILKLIIVHRTKWVSDNTNIQTLLISKEHLHILSGYKNFLITLSTWRFLFLMMQLSMLSVIISDCNWTRTHNHLLHKWTLNHLAKLRPIWPNGWVFAYELRGCGFESSCSHLDFRFRACFEQGVP